MTPETFESIVYSEIYSDAINTQFNSRAFQFDAPLCRGEYDRLSGTWLFYENGIQSAGSTLKLAKKAWEEIWNKSAHLRDEKGNWLPNTTDERCQLQGIDRYGRHLPKSA